LATEALVFVAVVLPVMVFFLFQFWLLLKNSSQVHGLVLAFAFAITVWFFVALPCLGWHFGHRRPGDRSALHRAAWALLTYIVMFGAVGRLMSA
jgi:multisubunit Na+/H+ antiporter MnhE subunit